MCTISSDSARLLGRGIDSSRGGSVPAGWGNGQGGERLKKNRDVRAALGREQGRGIGGSCAGRRCSQTLRKASALLLYCTSWVGRGWCPQGTVPFCPLHVSKALKWSIAGFSVRERPYQNVLAAGLSLPVGSSFSLEAIGSACSQEAAQP